MKVTSSKSRKQHKLKAIAPLHLRHKILSSNLCKELREKYGRRSIPVRKGDTVKIMCGDFRGTTGIVNRIDLRNYTVYVDGINTKKADGTDVNVGLDPSNLQVTELYLEDKERRSVLELKMRADGK